MLFRSSVRDASGAVRGGVSDDGTLRDRSGTAVGRLDGCTVRDRAGSSVGRFDGCTPAHRLTMAAYLFFFEPLHER